MALKDMTANRRPHRFVHTPLMAGAIVILAAIVLPMTRVSGGEGIGDRPLSTPDSLTQMEVIFEGEFRKAQIKAKLDQAMRLFGVPSTEENYSHIAGSLVALRQQNGTREMDLLEYMIRSYRPGMNSGFESAAESASAFLAAYASPNKPPHLVVADVHDPGLS